MNLFIHLFPTEEANKFRVNFTVHVINREISVGKELDASTSVKIFSKISIACGFSAIYEASLFMNSLLHARFRLAFSFSSFSGSLFLLFSRSGKLIAYESTLTLLVCKREDSRSSLSLHRSNPTLRENIQQFENSKDKCREIISTKTMNFQWIYFLSIYFLYFFLF